MRSDRKQGEVGSTSVPHGRTGITSRRRLGDDLIPSNSLHDRLHDVVIEVGLSANGPQISWRAGAASHSTEAAEAVDRARPSSCWSSSCQELPRRVPIHPMLGRSWPGRLRGVQRLRTCCESTTVTTRSARASVAVVSGSPRGTRFGSSCTGHSSRAAAEFIGSITATGCLRVR